mmetsp:Transcript_25391/g.38351  ORF Transcript_25391/g.38351 Transcript_25391/m.38351 type:complete len:409 (-) Transcript_25391:405-1631(-)
MKIHHVLLFTAGTTFKPTNSFSARHCDLRRRSDQNVETILFSNDKSKNGDVSGYRPGSLMAATLETGRVPYGEESRKYRRTVFTSADWVKHRNTENDIVSNLKGVFFSGVVRQLKEEILLVSVIAVTVVLWNDFFATSLHDSLAVPLPQLILPSLPFTLSSPALGLLLVFRTNASYARWLEARNAWAKILSQSRNMVRMAATFTFAEKKDPESQESIEYLACTVWLLSRSLMNDLSGTEDEESYRKELNEVFSNNDALIVNMCNSSDRTMSALACCSQALNSIPIDEKLRVETDKSLVLIGDCIGVCEKIFSSPVPLVYTRHTGRFLSVWMVLLPSALYKSFLVPGNDSLFSSTMLVPAVALVALFLFGIEELAIQLEEPFSVLPMQNFCDTIRESASVLACWSIDDA